MKFDNAVKPEGSYGRESHLPELHVNMSNQLIRAAHSLTLNEKRVIACCIAQLDSIRSQKGAHQSRVILRASDFAETYGVDSKRAYREMQAASEKMFDRYIRTTKSGPKGLTEVKFRWVSGVTYHHGEGWIELGFSPEVTPHLTLLREKYTTYRLKSAAALRSTYSWRMYELFVSVWDKRNNPELAGYLVIKLDDFRRAMDVPESYRWSNVRQKVVEPAVEEVGRLHNLNITWETFKEGRSVSRLKFDFSTQEQRQLDI